MISAPPASPLFGVLPDSLRNELLKTYNAIAKNFAERRWEPSELNGGKFSEVVFTILEGALAGVYPTTAKKPDDVVAACRGLERLPRSTHGADRSLRILIPRTIVAMYEVRNNRGVGHIGSDVDPNEMDATLVYSMARWVVAELVRIFHGMSTEAAQSAVDGITERTLPLLWEVDGIRRVLAPSMSKADQVLALLYGAPGWVGVAELVRWTEYSNPSVFRTKVLEPMHKERLLEHDTKNERAMLTPLGAADVEVRLLPGLVR